MSARFTAAIMLARVWWAFMLRGLLAVVVGIIVIVFPQLGLPSLILAFAAWMMVDGIAELIGAWRSRGQRHWWVGILEGIAGIVAGLLAVVLPGLTALVLLYLVA
ncbi:MAG TPA: DUF308 domain-containing protein, partial [Gemmatimonadales bacterium]|nr:DUF308 domain-containing protein [Gemmatimonadales bacterium]